MMEGELIKLHITDVTVKQLADLTKRVKASNRAETIRNALRVYSALVEIEERGGHTIVHRDGEEPVTLSLLEPHPCPCHPAPDAHPRARPNND